jgi:nitrite reductase (cytochrome c-552)
MLARAVSIQEKTFNMRDKAMNALVDLINDIKTARVEGVNDDQLSGALVFQKRAQFFLDFVEAENSMGFHAPQESVRILGESINFSRQGSRVLRGADVTTSPLTLSNIVPTPAASKWVVAGGATEKVDTP